MRTASTPTDTLWTALIASCTSQGSAATPAATFAQIDVDWDNGRRLILFEGDPFEILSDTGGGNTVPIASGKQGP